MSQEIKKPFVEIGDWISVGQAIIPIKAVVCRVYNGEEFASGSDLEVVYLDGKRAINEGVIWDKNHWSFKRQGPCGGYSDNSSRLSECVSILKRGFDYKNNCTK